MSFLLNPAKESVALVDGANQVIGQTSRAEMREQGLLHQVTYIFVFNELGEVLLQKRTDTKDWYPGRFDFAAGGVVNYGEDLEPSAIRELQEELGVKSSLKRHFDLYFEDHHSNSKSWGRVFSTINSGPFILQPEEIVEAQFISIAAMLKLADDEVTPDTRAALLHFID